MVAAAEPVAYQAEPPGSPVPANEAGAAENPPDAPPLEQLTDAAVQPISANQPLPAKIQLSAPAAELVKLAQSGVDQGVMLAFVTNSQSIFNLSAEEIIYLNDVGVPSPVVTAMIQRDQSLKAAGVAALAAQSPPAQSIPAPAAVAPQPATAPLTPPNYAAEPPPVAPVEEANDSMFYDSLAPYGTWVDVAGYGACWRPSVVVVNPTWQPYFDGGHWVYTDCGWYWMSDYSWGWAPFHYGRWFHHNNWGWCWAPDTVWGPSWVAWRSSADYCGWAPLPPGAYFSFSIGLTFHGHPVHHWDDCGLHAGHYRFVAWHDFDHHRLNERAVPPARVNQIYRNTVVVNNITINNNHTVVNNGVSRDRVAAATHRDIKPVALRTTTTVAAGRGPVGGGHAERLNGNTLTVYRPSLAKPAPSETVTRGNMRPMGVNASGANYSKPAQPATVNTGKLPPGKPANVPVKPTAGNMQNYRPGEAHPNPSSSAWQNADPNSRFQRIQPPASVSGQPRQYTATPTAQQPQFTKPATAPLVPQNKPNYSPQNTPQQHWADVPRYAPSPNYNQQSQQRFTPGPTYSPPQRNYATPPSYSQPQSSGARPGSSYEAPRSAAPAPAAPRAPSSDSHSSGNGGGGSSGNDKRH